MGKQFDNSKTKKKTDGKKPSDKSSKVDAKKKSTMKMQKKHQKQEAAVKDVQLKVGPTKRISKIAKPSVPTASEVIKQKKIVVAATAVAPVLSTSNEPLVELRDTVKDQLAFNKQKKVDQGALKKAIKKLDDKSKRVPLKDTAQNRTIYVGHLPHGLLEEQLKTYFTQYGSISNIKVARSRKTARSKGYAFIQFEFPEVAAVAAKAMNGHMVLGKVLEVHVLESGAKNPFAFKDGKKQYKFINWKRLFVKEHNQEQNPAELKKRVVNLLVNEKKKRQMIEKAGIDYSFPGFQAIIDGKETTNNASAIDEE